MRAPKPPWPIYMLKMRLGRNDTKICGGVAGGGLVSGGGKLYTVATRALSYGVVTGGTGAQGWLSERAMGCGLCRHCVWNTLIEKKCD